MKIATFSIDSKDATAIERINYEISSLKAMIDFFVSLCDNKTKTEMLDNYIKDYKSQLEKDIVHLEMIKNHIVREYFPEGYKLGIDNLNYFIGADNKEISYYDEQKETK